MRVLLAALLAAQQCFGVAFEALPETRVEPAPIPGQGAAPVAVVPPLGSLLIERPSIPDLAIPSPELIETQSLQPIQTRTARAQRSEKQTLAQRMISLGTRLADLTGFGRSERFEASSSAGERQIRLLQGGTVGDENASAASPAPPSTPTLQKRSSGSRPPQDPRRAVRLMMWGTPAFKLGAEVVTLSLPQLVLKAAGPAGGAAAVAMLLIVYQAAQAVVGMATPMLLRRFPASKVLAASVLTQAVLVAALVGLSAAHLVSTWSVLPFYGLLGAAIGVADTARRLIPSLLLGHDEDALRDYNARLHRRYETAGVIGSAAGGLLIATIGPLYAMLIQPPAYLVSAWLFSRVRHQRSTIGSGEGSWRDVFRGAKKVAADPRLRWLAAAMILPQIIHRVFENLVLPVYAKTVLGAGALTAALLTASNLGELGGASFMLKRSKRYPGPSSWVRWAAFGLIAGWALPAVGGLPLALALGVLAPCIFVFSSTWAGSHLSLESAAQKLVAEKEQPGVVSFLNGLFILGTAAASLLLGRLLDAAGTPSALLWICGGFTAVAAVLWSASRALKYNRPQP